MNERINQLADQADIRWLLEFYPSLETFAELIVKECAKIADKAEPYKATDLIKEHFGIKE